MEFGILLYRKLQKSMSIFLFILKHRLDHGNISDTLYICVVDYKKCVYEMHQTITLYEMTNYNLEIWMSGNSNHCYTHAKQNKMSYLPHHIKFWIYCWMHLNDVLLFDLHMKRRKNSIIRWICPWRLLQTRLKIKSDGSLVECKEKRDAKDYLSS